MCRQKKFFPHFTNVAFLRIIFSELVDEIFDSLEDLVLLVDLSAKAIVKASDVVRLDFCCWSRHAVHAVPKSKNESTSKMNKIDKKILADFV